MRQRPFSIVALVAALCLVLLPACAPESGAGGETFAGLPVATPESAGMSSERLDRIGPAFERYVADAKLSGVITVVARGGKVVHVEASGHQNVGNGEPMTEGDDMKTEPARRPIVVRDLMTHTSGLTYSFIPSAVAAGYTAQGLGGSADQAPHDDLAHYVRDLAAQPLLVHPGTAWNYSLGLEVAGRVIEVVSGQTFREFLKERIFDPLGMVDTDFYVPDEKLDRFAVNYAPTPEGGMMVVDDPETSAYRKPPKVEMGGSGLVATAGDYLRFAQMLANGGELDGVRVLGPQTVALMMNNHLGSAYGPSPMSSLNLDMGMSEGMGYGLGGYSITDTGLTGLPASAGTYGWGGAASTDFWVDPKQELVGMVLTQLLPTGTYPLRPTMEVLTYQAIVE